MKLPIRRNSNKKTNEFRNTRKQTKIKIVQRSQKYLNEAGLAKGKTKDRKARKKYADEVGTDPP